jgi:hypothetical protein
LLHFEVEFKINLTVFSCIKKNISNIIVEAAPDLLELSF